MEAVGLHAKAPDVLGMMSQILGVRQQQQALQGGAAQVRSAEQSQRQREALAAHDFNKYVGEDGTLDLNQVIADPELRAAAGDQFLDVLSEAAQAKQGQLVTKQALQTLRRDQTEAMGQLIGSIRGDPDVAADNDIGRRKVNDLLVQFGETYGPDSYQVLKSTADRVQSTPKGRMGDLLASLQRQAMDASGQRQAVLPQLVNTGSALRNINPDASPMAPMEIPLTLAPGQQEQLEVDQLGNPYVVRRTPRGRISEAEGLDGGGPAVFGAGERAAIEQQGAKNFESVSANRAAASMAPQQLDQINKALELSETTPTGGTWGAKRAQLESNIGSLIPGFQGMDDAAKIQELEKFTERIATDASRVLGVNARTDAERDSIHKQNANIGYTPKAIQAVLKYAKAQTLAMQAKGDAQEAWLQREGNTIMKQHDFETEFRKAYDPRVFQFEVMTQKEQDKFWNELSKDERKEIQEKTRKLIDLGAIPGA